MKKYTIHDCNNYRISFKVWGKIRRQESQCKRKDLWLSGRVKKVSPAIAIKHNELPHTYIHDWTQILVTCYFILDWAIGLLCTTLCLTKLCVSRELHMRRYLEMPFIKSKHLISDICNFNKLPWAQQPILINLHLVFFPTPLHLSNVNLFRISSTNIRSS